MLKRGPVWRLVLVAFSIVVLGLHSQIAQAHSQEALAILKNSQGQVVGTALFLESTDGVVRVSVTANSLPPGRHGIHVHAVGRCDEPDFLSAGGHFNPGGRQHGLNSPAGPHAGDLPNLVVQPTGVAIYETVVVAQFTLHPGPTSLFDADGSALVIHVAEDDQVTDPTGNSGARIACGVITPLSAQAPAQTQAQGQQSQSQAQAQAQGQQGQQGQSQSQAQGLQGQTQVATSGQALEDALRLTVQGAVNAWNRGDVEAFLSFFTDQALMELLDFSSRAEARAALPNFIGQDQITFLSLTDARLSDGGATAVVDLAFGIHRQRGLWEFVPQGGVWRIDGETILSVPIPSGVTAVDMRLVEYAFLYDRNAVASGNFAFRVANVGAEPHEVELIKINRPESLLDIVRSVGPEDEGPPEGIEFVAYDFFEQGEQRNMVFTQPLSAGRYGLLCFVEAPDGVPHALKGMMSEFTVGTATTGTPSAAGSATITAAGTPSTAGSATITTVRPPSTGDADLIGADSDSEQYMYAGFVLLALASVSSLLLIVVRNRA